MKGIIKLIEEQDMGLAFTDEVIQEIVKAGFDPLYGARPLRRAIQKLIENPISNLIIDGKAKAGDLIRVRVDKDELIFEIEKTVFQPKIAKNYHCQACAWDFENEIIANSTAICPKCLKHGENIIEVNHDRPVTDELKVPDIKPQTIPDKKVV